MLIYLAKCTLLDVSLKKLITARISVSSFFDVCKSEVSLLIYFYCRAIVAFKRSILLSLKCYSECRCSNPILNSSMSCTSRYNSAILLFNILFSADNLCNSLNRVPLPLVVAPHAHPNSPSRSLEDILPFPFTPETTLLLLLKWGLLPIVAYCCSLLLLFEKWKL